MPPKECEAPRRVIEFYANCKVNKWLPGEVVVYDNNENLRAKREVGEDNRMSSCAESYAMNGHREKSTSGWSEERPYISMLHSELQKEAHHICWSNDVFQFAASQLRFCCVVTRGLTQLNELCSRNNR